VVVSILKSGINRGVLFDGRLKMTGGALSGSEKSREPRRPSTKLSSINTNSTKTIRHKVNQNGDNDSDTCTRQTSSYNWAYISLLYSRWNEISHCWFK
jgi:hypothetical protein